MLEQILREFGLDNFIIDRVYRETYMPVMKQLKQQCQPLKQHVDMILSSDADPIRRKWSKWNGEKVLIPRYHRAIKNCLLGYGDEISKHDLCSIITIARQNRCYSNSPAWKPVFLQINGHPPPIQAKWNFLIRN